MKEKAKYSKALGKRIKTLREAANISLKQFEVLSESIDRHAMSRIENGKTTPSVYTIFKICNVLKISQSELFKNFEF
ncbi:MAG TPA: helix-turn-helix transcriptional regulator [Cyclobacteriaceae bacterium]